MDPSLDSQTVVGVVAIINALATGISLIITTWFSARRGGRDTIHRLEPPKNPDDALP